MKLKVLALGLFVLGLSASMALAGPPAGKGKNKHDETTSASTTSGSTTAPSTSTTTTTTDSTTTSASNPKKVTLCHLTGSKSHPWVKITVSAHAAAEHSRHGDVAPDASGNCPATAPAGGKGHGDESTTTTTTTATTTAAGTTTSAH